MKHQDNGRDAPHWPAPWPGRGRRSVEPGTPGSWPHGIIAQEEAEEQRQEIEKTVISGYGNEQLQHHAAATGYEPQAARRQE